MTKGIAVTIALLSSCLVSCEHRPVVEQPPPPTVLYDINIYIGERYPQGYAPVHRLIPGREHIDTAYWDIKQTAVGNVQVDGIYRPVYVYSVTRRQDRWYVLGVYKSGDTLWGEKKPCIPYCIPK